MFSCYDYSSIFPNKELAWETFELFKFKLLFSRPTRAAGNIEIMTFMLQATVLHRGQTDEWKGWMQLTVLIYHISGASHRPELRMLGYTLMSSYLFMSGYGHFVYFWNSGDFSLHRLCQVKCDSLSICSTACSGLKCSCRELMLFSDNCNLTPYPTRTNLHSDN